MGMSNALTVPGNSFHHLWRLHDPASIWPEGPGGFGHLRAGEGSWRVDANGVMCPTRDRIAQYRLRRRGADGDNRDFETSRSGLSECELQRRSVGRAHTGEPCVVGLTGVGDPLQAGDDHVRRKTTPWPPSG